MRGRHDNHQRFEVPATNGSRPIAGGRLCGGKVSGLFRTGEWICRRSNRSREALDRILLFGWLLSQRDPIELCCEGVMRQPEVCKHQVCDHCGGRFGMVTHRWWGNKFCKRTCKETHTSVKLRSTENALVASNNPRDRAAATALPSIHDTTSTWQGQDRGVEIPRAIVCEADVERTYSSHLGLLCARQEWPRSRAAEKRDEVAALIRSPRRY